MPAVPEYLIADTVRFVHDTIDGETLLLDNVSGHLLMIGGFGVALWPRLVEGVAVESLLADVANRFGRPAGETCRVFLETLIEAAVLVPANAVDAGEATGDWPQTFVAPLFERYDDIANIIAMDPIHEVDESTGWPKPRAAGGK